MRRFRAGWRAFLVAGAISSLSGRPTAAEDPAQTAAERTLEEWVAAVVEGEDWDSDAPLERVEAQLADPTLALERNQRALLALAGSTGTGGARWAAIRLADGGDVSVASLLQAIGEPGRVFERTVEIVVSERTARMVAAVRASLASSDAVLRAGARRVMEALPPSDATKAVLRTTLQAADPTTRDAAAANLYRIRASGEGGAAWFEGSVAARDPRRRESALRVLRVTVERDPSVGPSADPLLRRGLLDPDPSLRTLAAGAVLVYRSADPEAVSILCALLRGPPGDLASAAAQELGAAAAGSPMAARALEQAVRYGTGETRSVAARAAFRMDAQPAALLATWLDFVRGSDLELQGLGEAALSCAGADGVPFLAASLERERVPAIRLALCRALAHRGAEATPALAALRAAAADSDATVAGFAVLALSAIPSEGEIAVAAGVRLIGGDDAEVALEAAGYFRDAGPLPVHAVPAILQALQVGSSLVWEWAIGCLVGSPVPADAWPDLLRPLRGNDDFDAWGAIRAYSRMGAAAAPARDALRALLAGRPGLRVAIAAALVRIGPADEALLRTLRRALEAPLSAEEKATAALALLAFPNGRDAALAHLRRVMSGARDDSDTGLDAVLAGMAPDCIALVPEWLVLLREGSWAIRESAVRALGRIGPGAAAARSRIEAATRDPNVRVRLAARGALRQITR